MGTSQSSPGPGGGTPLVPPWADDEPEKPLLVPLPSRFRSFRRSIGSFVRTGDHNELESALGHYARRGSGGGTTASRRMGSVSNAGANLYSLLIGESLPSGSGAETFSLNDLAGEPCEHAIAALVQALTPEGGDADKIRVAMNHALVEALDGIEVFDPSSITDEVLVDIMISYLAESVFLTVVMDGGDAWKKADAPINESSALEDLWELIKVVVDKHMAPQFLGRARSFTRQAIIELERRVVADVWAEWESYK